VRVNILGCAAKGWQKAPKKGSGEGEVWGLNDVILYCDVDVVIDCHHMKRVMRGKEIIRRSPEIMKACLKKLKKTGTDCYSTSGVKDIPNIMEYPYDRIVREFDSDYFASGPDYAVALAIYKGFTEIHTYGILMVVGDEYDHQRPSFEHWLGVAKGRGVKTVIHDHSNLAQMLKTPTGLVYGFNRPQRWRMQIEENPKKFIETYS